MLVVKDEAEEEFFNNIKKGGKHSAFHQKKQASPRKGLTSAKIHFQKWFLAGEIPRYEDTEASLPVLRRTGADETAV